MTIVNPDPSKQAQEVIFSGKLQKSVYPLLHFNSIAVTQKHLGMLLDLKLDFQDFSRTYRNSLNEHQGAHLVFNILPFRRGAHSKGRFCQPGHSLKKCKLGTS